MEERLTCLEKSKDQVGTVAHVKRQKLLINMQDAAKTPRKSCSSAVSLPNIHVQKSKSKSTPSLSTDISQSSKSAEKLDDSGISLLDTDTSITGSKLRVHQRNDPANANISSKNDFAVGTPDDIKLLKPLALFGNSEERDLAAVIHRDIFTQSPNVRWSDVVGLDRPKQILKEAVVFPLKYPELFTGLLKPWKGILLYGPPGTGKTMLAKAVATECQTTFFNISASSIVSKWRGDSEKLVRVLFELARFHAPSTIFLDELDAIMSARNGDGEHEGSRRMKTELLIQMDGLARTNDRVFVLAASNLPWELDIAILRRLEKRILINLPEKYGREAMFAACLPADSRDAHGHQVVGSLDLEKLAFLTEGYSGADIASVCKEAAMIPLREAFNFLEELDKEGSTNMEKKISFRRRPIETEDVYHALETTKSSSDVKLTIKYDKWHQEFGSV